MFNHSPKCSECQAFCRRADAAGRSVVAWKFSVDYVIEKKRPLKPEFQVRKLEEVAQTPPGQSMAAAIIDTPAFKLLH